MKNNPNSKNNRRGRTLSERLLSHTISWETGRSVSYYDQEHYRHTEVEVESEVHYGSQISCGRCRRMRYADGLEGVMVTSNLSPLGWSILISIFLVAMIAVAYR